MRKTIAIALTFIMFLLAVPATYAKGTNFPDVDKQRHSWALESIDFMVEKGVINGYQDGTFRPDNNITKAEFVTMIYRLFDKYRPNTVIDSYHIESFDDVPDNHWAHKPISELVSMDWWNTYYTTDEGFMFNPEAKLTRIGAVNMLPFIYEEKKLSDQELHDLIVSSMKDIPVNYPTSDKEMEKYTQDGRYGAERDITNETLPLLFVPGGNGIEIDDDYTSIVGSKLASLQLNGIMTSYNNEFEARDLLTRAEAVTILHRLYKHLSYQGELSKYAE